MLGKAILNAGKIKSVILLFGENASVDGLAKSRISAPYVIPAKAGIQFFQILIDSRLRGNDKKSRRRRE